MTDKAVEIEEGEITEEMEATTTVNSTSVDEQGPVIVHLSKVTQMEEDVLIPIKSEMSDNPNQADIIENGGSNLESMMEIKDDCIEEQGYESGNATAEIEPQPKTAARPSHFRNGHVVSDLHMWYVMTKVREQYQEEYDRLWDLVKDDLMRKDDYEVEKDEGYQSSIASSRISPDKELHVNSEPSMSPDNVVGSKVTHIEEDILIPIKSEMSDEPNEIPDYERDCNLSPDMEPSSGPDNELNMSPNKEPSTSPDVEPISSPMKELNVNQTLADIIHRNKEFLCVKCGKTCKSKSDLKKHAKLHGNPTKPYLCKMCNKTFRVAVDWNMHMNQQHTASERFQLLGFSGKAYRCYECHKKFKKASELRKHDTINTEEEPFACSKCNVMLERECDMRRHELSHIDPTPFKCTKCNEQFRTQHSLEKHQVVHCEKAFSCNQCDAKFVKASGLKSHHERTKHSNKSPMTITVNIETDQRVCNDPEIFKCSSCYLTFKTENAMKAHEITHTKAAPFTITTNLDTNERFILNTDELLDTVNDGKSQKSAHQEIMAKLFIRCSERLGHLNHLTENEKGWHWSRKQPCSECLKKFNDSLTRLSKRQETPVVKPFPCSMCPKSFADKSALNQHVTVHGMPMSCPKCEKQFANQNDLKKHKKIHVSDEYACTECNKKFGQENHLKKHEKRHERMRKNGVLYENGFRVSKNLMDSLPAPVPATSNPAKKIRLN